jgi:hypothetical protein
MSVVGVQVPSDTSKPDWSTSPTSPGRTLIIGAPWIVTSRWSGNTSPDSRAVCGRTS